MSANLAVSLPKRYPVNRAGSIINSVYYDPVLELSNATFSLWRVTCPFCGHTFDSYSLDPCCSACHRYIIPNLPCKHIVLHTRTRRELQTQAMMAGAAQKRLDIKELSEPL